LAERIAVLLGPRRAVPVAPGARLLRVAVRLPELRLDLPPELLSAHRLVRQRLGLQRPRPRLGRASGRHSGRNGRFRGGGRLLEPALDRRTADTGGTRDLAQTVAGRAAPVDVSHELGGCLSRHWYTKVRFDGVF